MNLIVPKCTEIACPSRRFDHNYISVTLLLLFASISGAHGSCFVINVFPCFIQKIHCGCIFFFTNSTDERTFMDLKSIG